MRFFSVLLGMLLMSSVAEASTLKSMDVKESNATLYAHFESQFPLKYRAFTLDNPPRFVIDFANVRQGSLNLSNLAKGKHMIKQIRSSESAEKLRLVFDLDRSYAFDQEVSASKHNVMITLHQPHPKSRHKPVILPKMSPVKKIPAKPKTSALVKSYRPIVVVIDPGHGGKDPGASGGKLYKEKNIVLGIAKRLAAELNKRFGFRAILTRSSDKFISLRERLNIARHYNADMFVSIHADAYKNHRARGASVFALSERGATSEAARWLAERENSSELMGGVKLDGKGAVLRSVLIDLSQTATTGASLEIGADVLSELKGVAKLHKGKVEQAAFVVLKSPDIPSLLVETGFVSNSQEVRQLSSSSYQRKLAKAVGVGIEQYFIRRPLRGTMLDATKRGLLKHVVVRGDNLSLIAKRYQTSVEAVKKTNRIKNNVLHVGQVLIMPKISLP